MRSKLIRKYYLTILLIFILVQGLFGKDLPEGFVYINEFIPNAVIDLRYSTDHNFIGKPIDGYKSQKCIISKKAAIALKEVEKELAEYGFGIKIFDSYRPQRAVDHFVRWAKVLDDTLTKSEFYPTVDKKDLFKKGFITSKSSHTRGSTVDLTIINLKDEKKLDMGSNFDYFGKLSWVISTDITTEQQAHRALLQIIMKKHGFKNYSKEWWHFTLKNEPFPKTYFDFPVE
ncbi:MAG: M15 family metallopeptidase [Candidatus Marinimicrobia bacterium]|jgi:D-alanyl-D-alanine dipeptidase|nr:M15 family metallopeptidase [Candidatus Neomarinimicrobiota bacterium]